MFICFLGGREAATHFPQCLCRPKISKEDIRVLHEHIEGFDILVNDSVPMEVFQSRDKTAKERPQALLSGIAIGLAVFALSEICHEVHISNWSHDQSDVCWVSV